MLREVAFNEWFTVFTVLGFAAIALSKQLFSVRFNDFVGVLGNSKYLKIYSREQKFIDGFDSLLFVNLSLSLSIFGYLSYSTIVEPLKFDLALFLKVVFGVSALILIKVLLERLVGSLFEIDKLIDNYLFQKTSYLNFSGFLLLPINALLLYSIEPTKTAVYISIGIVILVNLIGLITSFITHQKLILNNLFYFILYLCALEIGPYLILYKLIFKN
ncbi:MAG TPA: DUF4271 domain-containing protein [Aquaticitalea sp.]|nr:DUF4271 domain-containing protein [Aquaticitalea sp.]HNU58997.1 DUF4271 domain-containing protein [Aquaticitalea sp.]